MKNPVLLLAALSFGFSALSAQTVPEFLNYQGTVTDSAGLGLGDTAPVNRKVLFRIRDAATEGSLIWTEEQTVTISKGEFSVLLGQGIQFAAESHESLLTVFGEGATDRFLEVTVDNGDGTLNASDLPIAPRQRITSTAYSFRAGTADSIASGSSLKLNTADSGLGYYDSSRQFGGIAVNGPVLYGAGGGALGVDNGAGTQTTALRWDSGGDVGIGVNAPLAGQKLHVAGSSYFDGSVKIVSPTATAFTIQSPTAGGYGLKHTNGATSLETWVSPGQANLESNGTLNILAASTLSLFTNNSSRLIVNSTGNVGIGTANPAQRLDVVGGYAQLNGLRISGLDTANTIFQATGDMAINTQNASQRVSIGSNVGGTVLTVKDGNVGIGITPESAHRLLLSKSAGGSTPVSQQHNLQLEIRSGTGSAGKRALGIGVLDDGSGMIQAKEVNVGYNSLLLNPVGGNVGIGTSSPSRGKLEISGFGPSSTFPISSAGFGSFTVASTTFNPGAADFSSNGSLYCSSWAVAEAFYAVSDERIKDIIGVSDGSEDLSTLMQIEVTDYTFKDKLSKGAAEYKKVIAQQVESVYPKAVLHTTDTIPDIYAKAHVKGDWVKLETGLKVGERVRLFNEEDDGVYEVLEVEQDRFRTELVTEGEWVFVFGREVDDFRNVDYEALAVLNISATQELARQLAAKESENTTLRTKVNSLETRLAAIEQLLSTK